MEYVEYARGSGIDGGLNALVRHEIDEIVNAANPSQAAVRSVEMVLRTNGDSMAVAELRRQAKLERQRKRTPLGVRKAMLRRQAELLMHGN